MPALTSWIRPRLRGLILGEKAGPRKADQVTEGYREQYGNSLPEDVNERYLAFWRACQQRSGLPERDRRLIAETRGFSKVEGAIPNAYAFECSQKFTREIEAGSPRVHRVANAPFLHKLDRPLEVFGTGILDIFRSGLDAIIQANLGSYYRVLWLDCYRTEVHQTPSAAWLWHIDNVPQAATKILLYLTGTKDTGGATEVLLEEDSNAFKRSGYLGLASRERVADLSAFAASHGLTYRPQRIAMNAGDVIYFHTNNLHRGVLPTQGVRDVISVFLLPSPIPWDQQLEADGLDAIQDRPGGFPETLPPM